MIRTGANPWGTADGIEAQRTDLWLLDLTPVILELQSQPDSFYSVLGLNRHNLVSEFNSLLYPRQANTPPLRARLNQFLHGAVPRMLPGIQDAVDPVRVDFLHDAPTGAFSEIYTLLYGWRGLVRMGRVGRSGEQVPLLPSASAKLKFAFDVKIRLLKGTEDGDGYEVGSSYLLEGCWLKTIQQADIDRGAAAQNHTITADLQPRNIRPV